MLSTWFSFIVYSFEQLVPFGLEALALISYKANSLYNMIDSG